MDGRLCVKRQNRSWRWHLPNDRAPEILMLLPDEPAQYGTGGAVRAWHFVWMLASFGSLNAFVLSKGYTGRVASDRGTCKFVRVSSPEEDKRISGFRRYVRIFLCPWQNRGRELILAGHNICVSRSNSTRFRWLHWLYGLYLLVVFSLLRRFVVIDLPDCHVRGELLDHQIRQISQHYSNKSPSLIWVEHSYMYTIAELLKRRFPEAQIAVNAHNVEYQLKSNTGKRHTAWLGRAWQQQEAALALDIERRMVRNAWLILACSNDDAARFRQLVPETEQHSTVIVAPNGVDTHHFSSAQLEPEQPNSHVVFTGTAGYLPNDDAVHWMLNEIWPLIQFKCPDAKLTIAGRNAGLRWLPLTIGCRNVEIVSDPEDMRPVLRRASVSIVPLRSGSGTRLKIVEALSMGLPVVSTLIGAEGLELKPESEALLEDTATGLANATVRLLQDADLRTRLSIAGRERAVRDYDWGGITQNALRKIRSIPISKDHSGND